MSNLPAAEFFQMLNSFYQQNHPNSNNYSEITSLFYNTHKEKFLTNQNKLFYQNEETYLSLNNSLITLKGSVVDLFENQMGITKIQHKNGIFYCLFNNLASDEIFDIQEEDILQNQFGDYSVFLVFVDIQANFNNFSQHLWKRLNDKFGRELINEKYIPLKVYCFDSSLSLKLGDQLELSGFLYRENIEEDYKPDINNMSYLDYYKSSLVYDLYCLDLKKIEDKKVIKNMDEAKFLIKRIQNMFMSIMKDELASVFLIFSLFTNCDVKISGTPLNFFTFNFYNISSKKISQITNIFEKLNLSFRCIEIEENYLKKEIFAKKNLDLGIMELNEIYPGSQNIYIFDETNIKVTKLTEEATKNIIRIKELIQFHQISLFFFGNQILKFPFENTVIGFSKYRSMFDYSCKICCISDEDGDNAKNNNYDSSLNTENKNIMETEHMENEEFESVKNHLQNNLNFESEENNLNDEDIIENIEKLIEEEILVVKNVLSYLKQNLNEIDFKKEDVEVIEKTFVEMRKSDKNFSQDDFTFIIKIAKYLTVMQFKEFLDKETFFEAVKIKNEISRRENDLLENIKLKENQIN